MIRTIFFDFGNVVCFFDHRRAVQKLLDYTDISADELFGHLYNGQLEDDYEANRISTDRYFAEAARLASLRCTQQEFVPIFADVFWLNEPVAALLPQLAKNYQLNLASNTNAAHFEHFSTAFRDALRPFSELCTSHQAGARKPGPEFFAHCQKFADCSPNECLFVDDLPANVEAACRHGWNGIVYTGIQDLLRALHKHGVHEVHAA